MAAGGAHQGPDRRNAIHPPGNPRQVFAHVYAWQVRTDWLEFAADIGRGLRLQVHRVLVGGATCQVDHDHGFVRVADSSDRFGPQNVGQRQSAEGQSAYLQKGAA